MGQLHYTFDLGAGHAEVIAENLNKRPPIFDLDTTLRAIHRQADGGSRNRADVLRDALWTGRGRRNGERRLRSLKKFPPGNRRLRFGFSHG